MNKELLDITSSQKVNLYAQIFSIKKCVTNVATSVVLDRYFDYEMLKKAIVMAVNRCEAMRLRFVRKKGKIKQYFIEHDEPEIGIWDFYGMTEEKRDRIIFKDASKKYKLFGKRQFRIYIYRDIDGFEGIYMNVNHMIQDSSGIMIFFKDILDIYDALATGNDMPKPMSSYKSIIIKELQYENSKQQEKDYEFWKEYWEKGEPIFTGIDGKKRLLLEQKKKKNNNYRAASILSLLHPDTARWMQYANEDKTAKWMQFCIDNNISFQCLVLLAVRCHLSAVNDREEDVTVNLTAARRATLTEKKCGGSRVHFFPFRTIFSEEKAAIDVLKDIKDEQAVCFRHCELNPLEIRNIRVPMYNITSSVVYEDISVTYQPLHIELNGTKARTRWHHNGASSNPMYLTIMNNEEKGLDFYYEYLKYRFDEQTVRRLALNIENTMDMVVDNKELTIGEILDILQGES